MRCGSADCPHRQGSAVAFVHKRPQECGGVFAVRVPMAVEAAEPRRGKRFVDRSEHIDRRIPPRDHSGISGEELRKFGVEEISITWSSAVMHQPCNCRHAQP